MKGNIDYVLFGVRDYYKDKVKLNNEELIIEPTFDPTRHVTICGEVVQVPVSLSSKPVFIIKEHIGLPPYGPIGNIPRDYMTNNLDTIYSSKVPPVHRMHDIEMDVRPGDRIYFHYNTLLNEENFVADNLTRIDGIDFDLWKVRYDQIFCAVRPRKKKNQGLEIIMVGSWCLVEPDLETWEDIYQPTYYDIIDPITKRRKPKPQSEWIQLKVAPEKQYLRGRLKHVGKALKGKTCELKQGDYIVYSPDADFEIEVEGKKYLAIRQNHIEGILEKKTHPIAAL